jgi:hypothetical protein
MDRVNQSLSSANWVALGSSVRGTHHIRDNQPRQDAFGIRLAAGDTILIAVADGVGSASQAEIGSYLAASTALDWLESNLWQSGPNNHEDWEAIFRESFLKASNRLEEQASLQGLPATDFATTLLLAAASPDYLITGQIGDGAIVAMEIDGVLLTVSHPQQGEYVNETFSITSPTSSQLAQVQFHPMQVDCLALFSDGLQRLSLHQQDNSPHQPFFAPLFQQLPGIEDTAKAAANLADFLSSERVNALTGDDKTLVLAKRKTQKVRAEV